ncbi:hypothetical protein PVAP13_1KG433705 [Panicum virgatum]|uniref:KIB1-4 beta-propeller domain-containing protein n=1 Tax=Panicum virgatum TaxID=38727 RepID=A0A8T0XYL3_PANVG|nr:hypothetical protein PVAP13_1KG433705 [Panicum virgatum]
MAASAAAKNSPDVPPELAIGSKPLLVKFNHGEQESHAIMDPFNAGLREANLELDMLRGKRCLASLEGDWLVMLDEATGECFLLSLVSVRRIQLPPLLKPVEELGGCALSSPTPPDCTIVFSTSYRNYLLYCRPGDKEWRELPVESDGTYRFVMGDIVSSRGRMYMPTEMSTLITIDVSMPSSCGIAIGRRGIPHPSKMRWWCEESLVEFDGDIYLLQFYIHGFYNSEIVDIDIHILDTSAYVWNKVESIAGENFVVLPSASRVGIQPGYIHLLQTLPRWCSAVHDPGG